MRDPWPILAAAVLLLVAEFLLTASLRRDENDLLENDLRLRVDDAPSLVIPIEVEARRTIVAMRLVEIREPKR